MIPQPPGNRSARRAGRCTFRRGSATRKPFGVSSNASGTRITDLWHARPRHDWQRFLESAHGVYNERHDRVDDSRDSMGVVRSDNHAGILLRGNGAGADHGLEPVFCDVSLTTHHMTVETATAVLDESVTAIHPVNIWGQCKPADFERFRRSEQSCRLLRLRPGLRLSCRRPNGGNVG